jgi:transcriptional regulator with XRE-family HTH domain
MVDSPESTIEQAQEVGRRLRQARADSRLSLRELGRRIDLSASALSQIETGKSRPSVKTLYAIVSELGLSLDELFAKPTGTETTEGVGAVAAVSADEDGRGPAEHPSAGPSPLIQRFESRASLELDSGVTWERLTPAHDPGVDFLCATYEVGGASSSNDKLVRHSGREYGIVLSGELELTVGFETHTMRPGDSASFESQQPHRLANKGKVPATAIWFVVGRRSPG